MMDKHSIFLYIIMALSILSFNCKSFGNSRDYITHAMNEQDPTFVFLQETWHISKTSSILSNASDNYLFKEISGVDDSSRILTGRPHGGLAIYFKRSIADKIHQVACSNNRLCAIRYQCDDSVPLLLINVYMP